MLLKYISKCWLFEVLLAWKPYTRAASKPCLWFLCQKCFKKPKFWRKITIFQNLKLDFFFRSTLLVNVNGWCWPLHSSWSTAGCTFHHAHLKALRSNMEIIKLNKVTCHNLYVKVYGRIINIVFITMTFIGECLFDAR